MSEYQKIEYLIAKDGKITEKVIGASGSDCISITAAIETSLGQISSRELLPEYHEITETMTEENQQLWNATE
jgi:hypothetical protein